MDAVSYELMIRQANSCGRHGVYGADADIYRAFERSVSSYSNALEGKEKLFNKSNEELCFDAGYHTGIVSAYIKAAIYKVMKEKGDDLSDVQYESLEQNLLSLGTHTKSDIDKVIESASEIFRAIGLLAQ